MGPCHPCHPTLIVRPLLVYRKCYAFGCRRGLHNCNDGQINKGVRDLVLGYFRLRMRDLLEKLWVTTLVGVQSQRSVEGTVNYRNNQETLPYFFRYAFLRSLSVASGCTSRRS